MKKVLLIEPNEEVRAVLIHSLEKHYCVLSGTTLQEARSLFSDNAPVDAVVCTYTLPDGNGLELYTWLRLEQRAATPFLLISGLVNFADARSCDFDFLSKPFFPAELLTRLQLLMRQARQQPVLANAFSYEPVGEIASRR